MISSTTNSKIKQVRALQTQRRARDAEHLFVLEGQRLLEEVLRAGVPAQLVLHTGRLNPQGRSVVNRLARGGAIVEEVSEPVMNACSATEHNPGLLAVVAQPQLKPPADVSLALVLDGIAEPGNLGALLRTAEAAGVQAVWLAPGSVDAFNPKVVRAAAGAHVRLPVIGATWEQITAALQGCRLWRAAAGSGQAYNSVDWRGRCGLLLSGETRGFDARGVKLAAGTVHVPMASAVESLNVAVAAGVILLEAARQRQA